MAYFAQAGSGKPYSHDSTRDEGASDQFGPARTSAGAVGGQAGPMASVQPQMTRPAPAALRASAASPFPAEGPDLYSNYAASEAGHDLGRGRASVDPVAFSAGQQAQPRLQDYVSDDYSVPGIGAQSYGGQHAIDQAFPGEGYASQTFPNQNHPLQYSPAVNAQPLNTTRDQGYHDLAYSGPGSDDHDAYGGAAAQSYGYDYAQETAQDGYGDADYVTSPANPGTSMGRTASLLGAAASLALVIGIGTWGYQLVMRDVSGVPVVRAVEGPMRAQPDNPGGRQADNQGLAVNSVAANGTAEAPADRLTLAPKPFELAQDDQPMSRLTAPEADLPPQEINQAAAEAEAKISEASVTAYRNGDIDSLVAELTDGVQPLGSAQETAAAAAPAIVQPAPLKPVEIAAIGTATAPSSALLNAPGVKVSLRPNLRPARFSPAATASASPAAARTTPEADPKSLEPGTRLAQLGAYESAEVARAEWDRIYARFEDYLEGKTRVIQRAESGGRTFYRLRAMGFEGLSDARRFCSTLVAGKADCIPVTTR